MVQLKIGDYSCAQYSKAFYVIFLIINFAAIEPLS